MTSPVIPSFARAHHVPEAAYGLLAGLAVLGTDAGAMAVWWWGEQGVGSPGRTWLVGLLTSVLVAVVLVLMVRHPVARRSAVGALAVALVLDAIVIGYELAGLR